MNSIEYARRLYLHSLYEPRVYRPGKFTAYGYPKEGRKTLLNLAGPGILKRIWSTAHHVEHVKLESLDALKPGGDVERPTIAFQRF